MSMLQGNMNSLRPSWGVHLCRFEVISCMRHHFTCTTEMTVTAGLKGGLLCPPISFMHRLQLCEAGSQAEGHHPCSQATSGGFPAQAGEETAVGELLIDG